MWLKKQHGNHKAALEQLGSLESELMDRVWTRGEICVRDLHAEFSSRLAYTTVMTTLDRLYKKKLLERRKVGKAFYYSARLSQPAYQELVAQHLIGIALQQGEDREAVLSCLVDAVSETDREMLDKLDELVKAKRRSLRRGE